MANVTHNPLVSIIVRTKDRPKLLKRALKSISAQTYRPIEVVLVNDGGCDLDVRELKGTLGDIPLNYVRLEKNMGRSHAGNTGIENAKGKYIGFLDDDDEFYPNHAVTLVSFLEKSDYSVAYTDSVMVYKEYNPDTHDLDKDVKKELAFSQDFNYDKLVFENYIPLMCLMFGRKVLVGSGGFDNSFDLYEDWDLLIRVGRKYPFYHIKEITANYNQWSVDFQISQVNRDPVFLRQAYLKVLSTHNDKITPNRIHDYMSEFVHARHVLKEFKRESDVYREALKDRDSRIDGLYAELREQGAELGRILEELKEKGPQLEKLRDELKEQERRGDELEACFREKTSESGRLIEELRQRDERAAAFVDEMKRGEFQIDVLNSELRSKDQQIDKLYTELKDKGPRVENLYNELRDRDSQISALTAELREREARIEALVNELGQRGSQVEVLSSGISERDAKLVELQSDLRERDAQLVKLHSDLREGDALMVKLYAEIGERDSLINSLNIELRDRDARIFSLSTELSERNSQVDTLISSVRKKDSSLDVLTSDLEGKKAEVLILQNVIREKDSLISAMKNTRGWRLLEKYRGMRDRIYRKIDVGKKTADTVAASGLLKGNSIELQAKKEGGGSSLKTVSGQNVRAGQRRGRVCGSLFNNVIGEPIRAKASIIIPTKNAGEEFEYALRRIMQQEGVEDKEVIVIDSGSEDRTLEIAGRYTQNVFRISPEDFHHARTRNLGAGKATGDFLVFTVQDAIPVSNSWLHKLLYPVYRGEASAVSARQIPRADADLFASWSYWNHNINYLGGDKDRRYNKAAVDSFETLSMSTRRAMASLDSVCLGIGKSTFDKYLFNPDYAEDLDLGIRLLADGHTIILQSSNAVIHSHNRQASYFLKRSYIDTSSLWNMLKIAKNDIPVEQVMGATCCLYAALKACLTTLRSKEDGHEKPYLFLHSLSDSLRNSINAFNPAWRSLRGDALLDDFFGKVEPYNHKEIIGGIYANLMNNLLSFSKFVTRYTSIQGIEEDFLSSIYKLFCITAGNYLGENTQARIDCFSGGSI